MKKNKLLIELKKLLSLEELPLLSNLEEFEDFVEDSNIEKSMKTEIKTKINKIQRDTVRNVQNISELIESVVRSKKDGY